MNGALFQFHIWLKKLWRFSLVLALVAGLAACASSDDEESDDYDESDEYSESDSDAYDEGTEDGSGEGSTDKAEAGTSESSTSGSEYDYDEGGTSGEGSQEGAASSETAQTEGSDSQASSTGSGSSESAQPMYSGRASSRSTSTSQYSQFQGSGEYVDYRVQAGDTLMKIAYDHHGNVYTWRQIYNRNRQLIQDPSNVPPGTVLKIEKPAQPVGIDRNGEPYLIVWGDTLGRISGKVYGSNERWKEIYDNNRQLIRDPDLIYAGFTLYYLTDQSRKVASTKGSRNDTYQGSRRSRYNSRARIN